MSVEVSKKPSAPTPLATPKSAARPKMRNKGLFSAVWTITLIVGGGLFLELGSRAEWWSPAELPAPSTVVAAMIDAAGTAQFWQDVLRTLTEVVAAIVAGSILGLAIGLLFWKLPAVGRLFEPYLVSFYAVPLVLFYPVMIVLVGINATSVIILATIMALIPMALNTAVGLNAMRPVYMKLARSVRATPRQVLVHVAIPAAGPYIVAGLRLAVVYALIGSIAMEFTTAQAGLGYRIRYLYEVFDNDTMFGHILAVLILSAILTMLLAILEKALLRGRRQ